MKFLPLYLFLFIPFLSCTESSKEKPVSSGRFGEIYVMTDDDLFTPALKSSLKSVLEDLQLLHGGEEPYFKLIFVSPDQMRGSLLHDGTLLVITKSGDQSQVRPLMPKGADSLLYLSNGREVRSVLKKDLWSSPQQALFLIGNNADSMSAYIRAKKEILLDKLLLMEQQEITGRLTLRPDEAIRKSLLDSHKIDLRIPNSYHIAYNQKIGPSEGMVWLRHEGDDFDLNVVIHYEPYVDTSQFELKNLIARRDSVEKPIGGEAKGSVMATDTQFNYPIKTIDFKGHFAREYSALWSLKNDFMGGPYYSVTVLDEKNNRLVTLEGFVYAPSKKKTPYLRELKGILYGVNF